jgi:uncharacterized membrane protein
MAKSKVTTIGNHIAPLRFVLFLIVFAVAAPAIALQFGWDNWSRAVMGGFDIAAIMFLLSLLPLLGDGESNVIRRHAAENDANRPMLLVITALLSCVVLVTVGDELLYRETPWSWLVILTLVLAWLFANMIYALHFAHLFYGAGAAKGGLDFPDTKTPDYWDFVYFAFTLGMTFQTSDVTIRSGGMRRIVLFQCVAAFIFNIGVLAFSINTLGGK